MSNRPQTGEQVLCRPVPAGAFERYTARPVRSLDDYQKMVSIRAAVFMAEQACPYEEEFDGNDLCATHFLVFDGPDAVGTLRMRWFAGFAKLERVVLLRRQRGRPALQVMLAEAFEYATRKGYRLMIAQIQARLWPVWSRTFRCRIAPDRPRFWLSDLNISKSRFPCQSIRGRWRRKATQWS
ncbi:MAG: putative GNAT family N-acyltransferase [Hyphomonas sp.]|jgi:predicted GNAT family N-acyltransferase